MNQKKRRQCPLFKRVPRVCGDEPVLRVYEKGKQLRSPRMRG